ncbi:hypothetical protein OHE40_01645 [Enterococcus faecium]|uniref:hypothetical protein n=1 Tax=Enterococcus TaxID=1350 RepID=UPI0021E80C9F|nr:MULTISPECIES: hypothetical protein [Enterococcus]MCV3193730.1 hypothetical protein [Enterococcus faecium]MCV6666757.1 hypothetical protein [Enterococcus faecium]MCW0173773.1 hypothetical protein [Enterococcus faecium]HBK5783377.1 hypothetical protein [Enterococcus faecium]
MWLKVKRIIVLVISIVIWFFPIWLIVQEKQFVWQSIVVSTVLSFILNLDKFQIIGYGDMHAVLKDADEKIRTMEELSEGILGERIFPLFANEITYRDTSLKKYETPISVTKYLEVCKLKKDLHLKNIKNDYLQKLLEYKSKTLDDIQYALILAIENSYSTEGGMIKDFKENKKRIEKIFDNVQENDYLDLEYSTLIRDQIIKEKSASKELILEWNCAMEDIKKVIECSEK